VGKSYFKECESFTEAKQLVTELKSQGQSAFVEFVKGKCVVFLCVVPYKIIK
jgi:hypothetical protein